MDELREHQDTEAWAARRYTMMAASNPQVWTFSTAGQADSMILNGIRERGLAAAAGASDDIAYYEWSAIPESSIQDVEAWRLSNPALGRTIHVDNIRAVLNDPIETVRNEVLCEWVHTLNPAIPANEWNRCGDRPIPRSPASTADSEEHYEAGAKWIGLDPDATTWLGLDLSPDRTAGALVATQRTEEGFYAKLLHTWTNSVALDDKAMANDVAHYCRKYVVETLAYSKRTASAVAQRLIPAGFGATPIDGAEYAQSCDELLGAVVSARLIHGNDAELTKQVLSAIKLPYGDGAWVIGRKASRTIVCATVALALASHFATRQETEIDIQFG